MLTELLTALGQLAESAAAEEESGGIVSRFLEWLRDVPDHWLLLVAGGLVFGETSLGLGFIAPGESGLIVLGAAADSAPKFLLMWSVTSVAAILGYCFGYAIGWYFGPKIRESKLIREHGAQGWDTAVGFLRRRGVYAVGIAIYLPVMRTLVPAAAGAAKLPFRKFLPAAALAGSTWCALHIGLGMAAGAAAERIEQAIGIGSWVVLGTIIAVIAAVLIRKRIKAKQSAAEPGEETELAREPQP